MAAIHERRVQRVGVRVGDDDKLLEQRERVLGDVPLLCIGRVSDSYSLG